MKIINVDAQCDKIHGVIIYIVVIVSMDRGCNTMTEQYTLVKRVRCWGRKYRDKKYNSCGEMTDEQKVDRKQMDRRASQKWDEIRPR